MARADFGGTVSDFTFVARTLMGRQVLDLEAATLTFWDAATGGTRHTDLLLNGSPVSSITVGDDGQIPLFQGPDGVTAMWADAGSGRVRMVTTDGAAVHDARVATEAAATAAQAVGTTNGTIIAGQINAEGSATRTALLSAITDLAPRAFDLSEILGRVNYTAHKAGGGEAPPTSLYAYAQAYAVGADFMDADIGATGDGIPVIFHDDTVDALTDGTGALADYSLARFRRINMDKHPLYSALNRPESLALADIIALYKDKAGFVLDVKDSTDVDRICAAVDKFGVRGSTLIGVHDLTALQAMQAKSQAAVAAGGQRYNYFMSWYDYGATLTTPTPAQALACDPVMLSVRGIGTFPTDIVNADSRVAQVVAAANADGRGIPIRAYTINTRYRRDALLAAGVTSFQTDVPGYLIATPKPTAKAASWSSLIPGYGLIANESNEGLPGGAVIASDGAFGMTSATSPVYAMVGELGPVSASTATVQFDCKMDPLPADANGSIRFLFGCPTDRGVSNTQGPVSCIGFYLGMGSAVNGQVKAFYYNAAGTAAQQGATVNPGPIAANTWVSVKLDLTPTTITVSTNGTQRLSFANPGIPALGYVHTGKFLAPDAVSWFRNLALTY